MEFVSFLLPPFFWFSTADHNVESYSGDNNLKLT
nr:MAG TPA: hypothetical protein [Caudoviricetes sp.]